jgi:tetratricopeptide (TPR) repeat protein
VSVDEPRAQAVEVACQLGRQWLEQGRPELARAEAERAIGHLLQHGLSVEEFVRLALRRAPAEILFRYERSAVATVRRLHLPLALRWEALRRSGRAAEAREMRAVCIRLFPERASVWAEAGNQALDERDLDRAQQYFERCLKLERDWTAGLAGLAIVHECRKEWVAALQYRERVVAVERARERDDLPSLQRLMRYAAALARVDRWHEAGVWFRRCLALGAYERLPEERPVLLRVFSRELYAPALVAAMNSAGPDTRSTTTSELAFALREASTFAAAYAWVHACDGFDAPERLTLLGMCAWLAADYDHAYELFDEAEVGDERNATIQLLLAWSAREVGASDCETIERFALQSAEAVLQTVPSHEPLCSPEPQNIAIQLRNLVTQRLLLRTSGATPLEAALASTGVMSRLENALERNSNEATSN